MLKCEGKKKGGGGRWKKGNRWHITRKGREHNIREDQGCSLAVDSEVHCKDWLEIRFR